MNEITKKENTSENEGKKQFVYPIMEYSKSKRRLYFAANGKRPGNRILFKYMSIDSFKKAIGYYKEDHKQTILFSEPSRWPDKFESRFYLADYKLVDHYDKSMTPLLYACCFTYKEESEAAWKVYADNRQGEEGYCVKLKINRKKLSAALIAALREIELKKKNTKKTKQKYKICEGKVIYDIDSYRLFHIHEIYLQNKVDIFGIHAENPDYKAMFENFSLNKYLNLLFLKRDAFEYEKEFRFLIIPPEDDAEKSKDGKIFLPEINWFDIIESIEVDYRYDNDKFNNLRRYCEIMKANADKFKTEKDKTLLTINKMDINQVPGGIIKIE